MYSDVCATLLEETALRSIPSTPPADPTCPGRGGILGKFIKTMILKPRKYTARMNFHTRSPLLSRLHVAQPREVADRCYGPPWRNRSRGRFLQVHAAGRGQSWAGRPGAGPGEEDVGADPTVRPGGRHRPRGLPPGPRGRTSTAPLPETPSVQDPQSLSSCAFHAPCLSTGVLWPPPRPLRAGRAPPSECSLP